MENSNIYLTAQQIISQMEISQSQLYNLATKGRVDTFKQDGKKVFRVADVITQGFNFRADLKDQAQQKRNDIQISMLGQEFAKSIELYRTDIRALQASGEQLQSTLDKEIKKSRRVFKTSFIAASLIIAVLLGAGGYFYNQDMKARGDNFQKELGLIKSSLDSMKEREEALKIENENLKSELLDFKFKNKVESKLTEIKEVKLTWQGEVEQSR